MSLQLRRMDLCGWAIYLHEDSSAFQRMIFLHNQKPHKSSVAELDALIALSTLRT